MSKIKKEQFNCRLPPDLLAWFRDWCGVEGVPQATVIEEMLQAKRSGRLVVRPTGPDAFPVESVVAGSSPNHPILIGIPPEPDPLLSDAFPGETP